MENAILLLPALGCLIAAIVMLRHSKPKADRLVSTLSVKIEIDAGEVDAACGKLERMAERLERASEGAAQSLKAVREPRRLPDPQRTPAMPPVKKSRSGRR